MPLRWTVPVLMLTSCLVPCEAALAQTTPIKHVVVIFQENVSFDHYFATYPHALNAPTDPAGTPQFTALPNTPSVNGLGSVPTTTLLTHNPNSAQAFRLSPADAVTCDNDNAYDAEQTAVDKGLQDKYPQATSAQPPTLNTTTQLPCDANLAMGYYDGNTVTAVWNYAQHYSMSDNFFGTEFGTTVMGHLNLLSGQTHVNVTGNPAKDPTAVAGFIQNGSVIANVSSALEDCPSKGEATVAMTSKNVGDLLNEKNVTWGWFYGDFPTATTTKAAGPCPSAYNNHYDPFQYYASTANPHHLPPTSLQAVGTSADQANHQYALGTLSAALASGNLPSVVFIKAPSTQTGHPQKSDPLSEQEFLVWTINELQASPFWKDMAVFITYDDSDGWYDHATAPVVNESLDPSFDHQCAGPIAPTAYNDRCGYGPRLPLLVISPYAKRNYVDNTVTDQTSVLRFIETNFGLDFIDGPNAPPAGQASFDRVAGSLDGLFDFVDAPNTKPLILNPTTGVVVSSN